AIRRKMRAPRPAFGREIASAQIARILARFSTRRDGRVVDGGGLENHCSRKVTGGSNPSPSASTCETPHLRNSAARKRRTPVGSNRARPARPSQLRYVRVRG